MQMILIDKKAFTLAEVLITLAIIGVIASLTLPSLFNDTQKAEYKSALKNMFSSLQAATKLIMSENGNTLSGVCQIGNRNDNTNCLIDKYSEYMPITKKCYASGGGTRMVAGCWLNQVRYLNGSVGSYIHTYGGGALFNNGAMFSIYYDPASCTGVSGTLSNTCGTMNVDVNGNKGPNRIGFDVYRFIITSNGLVPDGAQSASLACSGNGWNCAEYRLLEK